MMHVYISCLHDACLHDACLHDACLHDACLHDACLHQLVTQTPYGCDIEFLKSHTIF